MKFRTVSHEEIRQMIEAGSLSKIICIKNVPIFIRLGVVGEEVTTLVQVPPSEDSGSDLALIEETKYKVMDSKAVVVNQFLGAKVNQYIVHRGMEEIEKKYYKSPSQPEDVINLEQWNPKGAAEKVVYLAKENLEFTFPASWGQEGLFRLIEGGVLVDNEDGCFYGINPMEFHATHSILETVPAGLQS